jgi:hypothetical protein
MFAGSEPFSAYWHRAIKYSSSFFGHKLGERMILIQCVNTTGVFGQRIAKESSYDWRHSVGFSEQKEFKA